MPRTPKLYYCTILLLLIVALAGCQLSRDSNADLTDSPTPTLASLGADDQPAVTEATSVPTIINVQSTATDSSMSAGQAAENPNEPVAATSQPAEIGITPIANSQPEEAAVTTQNVAPETFTPPTEAEDTETPVIVNATTAGLPDGGPVAANPPAAQPGSYETSSYDGTTYVVQAGDTLFSISNRHGTTVEAFMAANNLSSDMIYEGQALTIPGEATYAPPPAYDQTRPGYPQPYGNYNESGYHIVSTGETLFSIAQGYGTSVEMMAQANGLSYPYIIYEGQYLTIPGGNPGMVAPPPGNEYYPQNPSPQAPSNGYYQPETMYPGPSGMAGTHTVSAGETLFSIAQYYGTSAQALAEANGLSNPNQIYVGQVLYLP